MRDESYKIVGSVNELILVNSDDNIIGYETIDICHGIEPRLHRAFSIFIFDSRNRLMLQKRSPNKRLWPGHWSNSVCSHPRRGESYADAASRRLMEEIGISTELEYLYKFEYTASYKNLGSEHELCAVFIGRSDSRITVDPLEIEEWQYITSEKLNIWIKKEPRIFTPWFLMEWEEIKQNFSDHIF